MSVGIRSYLNFLKSKPHLVMNLSIAFSVAPEFSIESIVLTETASPRSYNVESQQNLEVSIISVSLPSGFLICESLPDHIVVQVIWFLVRVPVLSEQMLLAPPIVSQDDSFLTKLLSTSIFYTEYASEIITARGSPSGTATTTIATPTMINSNQSLKILPISPSQ